ncbi:MAG: 4-(cytidine 5'-diphospho)-2-C-methyl-D-erythritol kinase [Prevotella sp.]|nr:4-(cytidine 5'-diphospho)-2-C-methyl-D-erythritol kinase [Prevotella sp.]
MLTFPCAKINLGLNITSKREDGYHNLETIFYPVPLTDALEVKLMHDDFPSDEPCDLKITGNAVDCDEKNNLVVKAYTLLAQDFKLPRVHTHLVKRIPMQAGLGGGSADGAFMIRLLDERFRLNMGIAEMERYASRLGSDCAFFITTEPSFGTGRGEVLEPVNIAEQNLQGYYIAIVKPAIAVSTREAFKQIICRQPEHCCRDIVRQPVETWKTVLTNDFEEPAFEQHPELADIKQRLYDLGAVYAQMSGSGSAFFGLFRTDPQQLKNAFPACYTFTTKL